MVWQLTSSSRSVASWMGSPARLSDSPPEEMADTVSRATAAVAPPAMCALGGQAAWKPAARCTGAAAASALHVTMETDW